MPATRENLRQTLLRIDGRGYPAYKDIRGSYTFRHFTLHIDHVQGDPFAAPSRLRVRIDQRTAGYPPHTYHNNSRRIGLETWLAAAFAEAAEKVAGRRGSGKSGLIEIDAPGQEMLDRTALNVTGEYVEARFVVGLPAQGRRILGRQAASMLCDDLPKMVEAALLYKNNPAAEINRYVESCEDADALRAALAERGLVAFVADGSILPRRSGISNRPLTTGTVIPFRSPRSLRTEIVLPNLGSVAGMGIPAGVTLVVGGGFHGKSTLLNAIERGIYNHIPDDGRELVATNPNAVKIRAEDGRRVTGSDISPFISNLPYGRDTRSFTTDNASGSTSQAANIIEALELGAEVLLIDEDTSATNFMIRDRRMQTLIAKDHEPITPFIDKVRQLYDEHGVSTVLVIGGSGDYFSVADTVIAMQDYLPHDVTDRAQAIAAESEAARQPEGGAQFGAVTARIPQPNSIDPSKGRRDINIKAHDQHTIAFGKQTIDLSAVSQLVDVSQTRALGEAINYARRRHMNGKRPLREVLEQVMADIESSGLDVLHGDRLPGNFAAFRKFELGAALNRLRTLKVKQG